MNLARIILICAVFVLTQFVPAAQAQRPNQARGESELRAVAQFRPRPAAERLATARRLLGWNFAGGFFDTPFSLTPNQPMATGHGWLLADEILTLRPNVGSAGLFSFNQDGPDEAYVEVHLQNAAGKRFLVDCTVTPNEAPVQAETGTISSQVYNPGNPGNLVMLSLVTAPSEDDVKIASEGSWHFWGCEVTRIQ